MGHRKHWFWTSLFAIVAVSMMVPALQSQAAVFVKYDGVDGESKDGNHDTWIDVLNVDWGASRPSGGASGQSRRRGGAVVEDLQMTFEYDKAAPKLQEKCLKGEVIPKLEIELTAEGSRDVYLKYELKKVMITSFHTSASDSGRATAQVSLSFKEIKVIYSELDARGSKKGNVETTWKVEKGAK